jgi:hypothetical protein
MSLGRRVGTAGQGLYEGAAALTISGANDRGKSFKPYSSEGPSLISSGSE